MGICASDGKVYVGSEKYWGKPDQKISKFRSNLPVIPGHEFSGKVVKLGPGAQDHHNINIGDLVVAEQVLTCGKCKFCYKNEYQVCTTGKVFGFNKTCNGAMAEYMIFPSNARVHKIPDGMDPFHAAFVEPLACSVHGVNIADIQFDDVMVVAGCGPIGLGMIAAAKQKSPKCIVALGNQK